MKKYFLFSLAILISVIQLNNGTIVDLDNINYDNIMQKNNIILLTLCPNNFSKCKTLKTKFSELSSIILNEMSVKITVAFLDVNNFETLPDGMVYEGIPTIYFINREENEFEVYLGSQEISKIIKYLKKKIITEDDIQEIEYNQLSVKLNSVNKAILFAGDISKAPFNFHTVIKASKLAGFTDIFSNHSDAFVKEQKIDEFDLIIVHKNDKGLVYNKLNLSSDEELTPERLRQIILINYRYIKVKTKSDKNVHFTTLTEFDLELILNHNIPALIYIFGDKQQLSKTIENELEDIGKLYRNQFLTLKISFSSKLLRLLGVNELFSLNKQKLPALIFLNENPNNSDDVEKYLLPNVFKLSEKLDEEIVKYRENVEKFITESRIHKPSNIIFTQSEGDNFQITGENLSSVIGEALKIENEIVMILCPKLSPKFERIYHRLERVVSKLLEANDNKIVFDHMDPLLNELPFINYNYYPTIALIQKSNDQFSDKKTNVKLLESGFTMDNIIKFIEKNSVHQVKSKSIPREDYLIREEKKRPIYPIHKHRFTKRFLSETGSNLNMGLKRKWTVLKKNELVFKKIDISDIESGNDYEDDETDDLDLNDHIKEDEYEIKDDL